ncbi:MAG TPA: HEAT repeat domain-containing protein, partial [Pyrinomonadaceae bacterium]|nr:HEAT repeat domain-containing protein [Pyrinomonadaceae bacterium]
MKRIALSVLWALFCSGALFSQIPLVTTVQIIKAEDARRYDAGFERLMRSPNAEARRRAALAAGRIGDARAVPLLATLLESDPSEPVRAMAAFALGEIESVAAADAILKALDPKVPGAVRARAIEAAGKIAAANAKSEKAKALSAAIANSLRQEFKESSVGFARLSLTAVLRARPTGAEEVVRQYLSFTDPNVVADALNTLARLRAKNANRDARDLLA